MALDILKETGVPLDRQVFTWRELAGTPFSKLDDDAFTRVRVILMNGIESEAVRFSHACARKNRELQVPLARVRRIEQHQQTLVNWLNPGDQSPLETTIGYEQTAIEVTAWIAQQEPDPYLASVYRFGMLEDFDHLYRSRPCSIGSRASTPTTSFSPTPMSGPAARRWSSTVRPRTTSARRTIARRPRR
jgi:hypothetical protein